MIQLWVAGTTTPRAAGLVVETMKLFAGKRKQSCWRSSVSFSQIHIQEPHRQRPPCRWRRSNCFEIGLRRSAPGMDRPTSGDRAQAGVVVPIRPSKGPWPARNELIWAGGGGGCRSTRCVAWDVSGGGPLAWRWRWLVKVLLIVAPRRREYSQPLSWLHLVSKAVDLRELGAQRFCPATFGPAQDQISL